MKKKHTRNEKKQFPLPSLHSQNVGICDTGMNNFGDLNMTTRSCQIPNRLK